MDGTIDRWNGQRDIRIDERINLCIDVVKCTWIDGWRDRWMHGRIDAWTEADADTEEQPDAVPAAKEECCYGRSCTIHGMSIRMIDQLTCFLRSLCTGMVLPQIGRAHV